MTVKLSTITNPDDMSVEEFIIYCARVSNPENQLNMETAPKLLKYLIDNKHWSPFEMASMTVEIKTSRAIAAQILRHRSFSFQEYSQRYSKVVAIEPVQLRLEHDKNRQSSAEDCNDPVIYDLFSQHIKQCIQIYNTLLEKGIAKECARMALPMCAQTTMYMTGTIRSWIHYLMIRDDDHVQLEHRIIAKEIKTIFCKQLPWISTALNWR